MALATSARLLLLGWLMAGSLVAQAAAPVRELRVSVNEANGPPFVLYDAQSKFVGGLARDIIDHLALQLGQRPVYLNLPRARVDPWLRANKIDAACFLAPDWVVDASKLRWSPALFNIRQVIISPRNAEPAIRPRALFGKRLGTLLNYTYPELAPYFSDGRIVRADAPSLASNIAKLQRRRIDAFLNDDVASLYAVKNGSLPADVRIDPLWAPENPVYCALSPAFDARTPAAKRILQKAVDEGRVEQWISAYTGDRRVRSKAPK
jgi:polar amino acid transport system substrate-binding protein